MTNNEQKAPVRCAEKINKHAGHIVFVKGLCHRSRVSDMAITWGLGNLRILDPSDRDYIRLTYPADDNISRVILDNSIGPRCGNNFLLYGRDKDKEEYKSYVAQIIDSKGMIIYEDKNYADRWDNLFPEKFNKDPFKCDDLPPESLKKILSMYGISGKS